ncbi:MAG: tRNA pseudouridine(38-40) synthase TruA [Candidatus Krumholzibacteriia bacterium]
MSEAMADGLPRPDDRLPADGRRVRLDLAYDGAAFHGWQAQPGLRTVQGELAGRLARLLRREIVPVGAGRTDAGVHARGQVCSLTVRDDGECGRLREHLASTLPPDLQLLAVRAVSPLFNARFSATARRYSYHLLLRPDIFRARYAVLVPGRLDRAAMDAAAAHFPGTHDFTSYCKRQSLRPDVGNSCAVERCRFEWSEDSAILHIRADHFLHNMVRAITGTLVEVGLGRRRPDDLPVILGARDRARAGRTMPARGLFLEEVTYPAVLLDPHHEGTTATDGAVRPPAREEES